ncbi:serine/threonine-protein kinase [Sphaerimonospora sp. CA-214678]|uniref:serine/threonine-protein kinase n=1 Tax=Sphaerimonospora sp. CA-214678 TaxID=3240029 RepID=UPI003D94E36F
MAELQPRLLAHRYELRTPIGRGTMGTVWRAYDRALGREIAIKEIRQDPGLTPRQRRELRERMLREGRTAAKISHPCVATIHDAIEADGSPWIIMELVEGRSLEQVIDEEGPLPPRLVAEIGHDLLGALRAAHSRGILHRDVKPSNVLLTETGRVVLTDFGIAKAAGDSALTQTGMVIGSPGYTAPERARGEHTGPESDLWSLGATLYFAVEGRPAYERGSLSETLKALMNETVDPPTQAGPLRPILNGLLEKDHRTRMTAGRAATMLRIVADTPTGGTSAGTAAGAGDEAADSGSPRIPAPGQEAAPRVAPITARENAGPADNGDDNSDQTMVVIRPKGGLRIPSVSATPPPAPDIDEVTAPRRLPASGRALPPRPGADTGRGGEQRAPEPPASGHGDSGHGPAHPAHPAHPGHGPVRPAAPAGPQFGDQSGEQGNGRPRGLGTDLFSVQRPPPPDTTARIRVLLLAGAAFAAFIVLVILIMVAYG